MVVSPQERHQLAGFARHLKGALDELASIVHPDTIRRWIREERRRRPRRPGHPPRTAAEIERLIVRLAKETGWGYCRILGELKKLGVQSVSATTVKNIQKRHGFDPGPRRGVGTWDEFLKIHAATLWQADFVSKRSLTRKGFRDLFVLVFLHVQTRRVYLSPATAHPEAAWVAEQARAFQRFARQNRLGVGLVMHDRDTKFTAGFDAVLQQGGAQVVKTAYCSPNLNSFVERFLQTLGQECLDYFVVFGTRHLDHLCREFAAYYHRQRPHQGKGNRLLIRPRRTGPNSELPDPTAIRCEMRLGGLLWHFCGWSIQEPSPPAVRRAPFG